MKKVTVLAPMRIDLAGGTTDIPPLFLFHHPAPVINAAVSIFASASIERSTHGTSITSVDQGITARFSNSKALDWKKYPKLELIIRLVAAFALSENVTVTVSSDAPRGSGLGASSALAIALTTALARWTGQTLSPEQTLHIAQGIETQTIRVPAGYQDYWAAQYGGLRAYEIGLDGSLSRERIAQSKKSKEEFAKYLHVIYTGTPHFSGTNNWLLFKQHIDGDKKTIAFFEKLKENAVAMKVALEGGSIKNIAQALNDDWKTRKAMLPGMTTPAIEQFTKAFFKMGGIGFRVCGAGGGGCAVALIDPRHATTLPSLLAKLNMKLLPIKLVEQGVRTTQL